MYNPTLQPTINDKGKAITVGQKVWYYEDSDGIGYDTEWEIIGVHWNGTVQEATIKSVDNPQIVRHRVTPSEMYAMSEMQWWDELQKECSGEDGSNLPVVAPKEEDKKMGMSLEEFADTLFEDGVPQNPDWGNEDLEDVEIAFVRVEALYAIKVDKGSYESLSETAYDHVKSAKLDDAYSMKVRVITESNRVGGFNFNTAGKEEEGFADVQYLTSTKTPLMQDKEVDVYVENKD